MSYKYEFPDFDYELPDLGKNWEDNSWHNDSCPSLDYSIDDDKGLRIWFQYDNPDWRECGGKKYILVVGEYGNWDDTHYLETDDLGEILSYIEKHKLKEGV